LHSRQEKNDLEDLDRNKEEERGSLSKENQQTDPEPEEKREKEGKEGCNEPVDQITGNKRQREQVFETLILFSGFPEETNQIKDLSQRTIELNGRIFEGHSIDQTVSHIVTLFSFH